VSETDCLLILSAVLKRNVAIQFNPAPDGRPQWRDGLPFVFVEYPPRNLHAPESVSRRRRFKSVRMSDAA
jgi:hypothetical protein